MFILVICRRNAFSCDLLGTLTFFSVYMYPILCKTFHGIFHSLQKWFSFNIHALFQVFKGYHMVSHVILHVETKEYCWETFNATCSDNEVILITSARYGRMKLGRCLSRDYYVGCSADVMPQADKICSGRHSCEMSIPDTSLHKLQPCPKDLMAYLQASYTCIQGNN